MLRLIATIRAERKNASHAIPFCPYYVHPARLQGRSKNYEFKCSLILLFRFRSLFVSFDVILSSFICHIARYAPSSTYKSTYERRTKINSTYFLERPYSKTTSQTISRQFRTAARCICILCLCPACYALPQE